MPELEVPSLGVVASSDSNDRILEFNLVVLSINLVSSFVSLCCRLCRGGGWRGGGCMGGWEGGGKRRLV